MLKSYQHGCPINESHVFYTATNTFRNPIFEPAQHMEFEPSESASGSSSSQAVQRALERPQKSLASCSQQPNEHNNHLDSSKSIDELDETSSKQEQQQQQQQQQRQPQRLGSLHKSCSNNASFSSNQSELGQRWQEFCDNLSLSLRGRLFVMEFKLKRRLRAMRKYLNKRLPWILQLMGESGQQQQQRQHQGDQLDKTKTGNSMEASESSLGGFPFPEPSSSRRALEAQQECLLNRLERIKRERLFRLPAQSLGADALQHEPLEDAASIEYIDHSGPEVVAETWQAAASAAAPLPGGETAATSAPVLLEDEPAKPLSLFSSISHSAQAAKLKPHGKRSRWISRSGRHIRDTALAFTSSKKSCIVCYERAPNIMTLPCEHSDICSDCFIEIIYMAVKHKQYPLRCVLCRQKVERIRCSRRLLLSVIEKNRTR